LGEIGRTTWLTVFAPQGTVGDAMAVVDGVRSTLQLTDDDLMDLATGLTKLMAAYDRMGIYNFNMSFFAGSLNDDHARFHMVFSPRVYFNPAIGTPDVAALGRLFGESVCMAFPEEINALLRPEFE
jgi:UDPglucose--hexose-1-phosphate uridylyltransferase